MDDITKTELELMDIKALERNIKRLEKNVREYANQLADFENTHKSYLELSAADRHEYERLLGLGRDDSYMLDMFKAEKSKRGIARGGRSEGYL